MKTIALYEDRERQIWSLELDHGETWLMYVQDNDEPTGRIAMPMPRHVLAHLASEAPTKIYDRRQNVLEFRSAA